MEEKLVNPFGKVATKASLGNEKRVVNINIDDIVAPKVHDRKDYTQEGINELARNIEATGALLQPIVLRELKNGKLERLIGFRRIEATKLLKWKEIPAIVLKDITDEQAILIMLSENLQRENLNVYDETIAILQYLAVAFGENEEIIKKHLWKLRNNSGAQDENEILEKINAITLKLGNITAGTLINRLVMLNFREEVLTALKKGNISYVAAKELHKLRDSDKVEELIKLLTAGEISYKELKVIVAKERGKDKKDTHENSTDVKILTDNKSTTFMVPKKLTKSQISRIEYILKEF